ncbi:MAG: tolC [Alphaproteobacteria bacterium]|nr:tolC [Alphaproteobacteria bacterium]
MKNFSPQITAILMAALLSGCAIILHLPEPAVMKDAASYETAQSFKANKAQWPEQNWWQRYNEPQLNDLVDEALRNSPDMAQAQARIRSSEAIAQQTRGGLFPEISVNANASEVKQSYNNGVPAAFVPQGFNDTGRVTLDFNYDLDFWGRNRAALRAATSEAEAARVEASQAQLVLTTAITAAYADLARLYADQEAAIEAVKVRKQAAALFQERFENGLENMGGVQQADALRAEAEGEVEAINENIALTKNRLAALTGAGPDRGLKITRPTIIVPASFGLPENLPVDLLGRRPDIVASRLRVDAASSRINAAKANFYPNINLSAYAGVQSLGLDLLTRSGSTIAGIGPAISLPIFDAGQRQGFFRRANADYDAAVASYNQAVTRALQDVADVAVSKKALGLRMAKTQEALDAAKKSHQVAQNRYKGGLATYIEVLRAQDTLIANKRALANIRSRGFTLDVALIRALGGGFSEKKGKE